MASRFLIDRYDRFSSALRPGLFLVAWMREESLCLSCVDPRREREIWERTVPDPSRTASLLSEIPLSPEERKEVPFLLLWPSERCFGSPVALPPSVTSQEQEMAVAVELEPLLPWPIEEVAFSYDLDRTFQDENATLYAWATPLAPLARLLESLQGAGLDPRWVIPEPVFLTGSPHRERDAPGARLPLTGILTGDFRRTQILLHRGGHLKGESVILHGEPDGIRRRDRTIADHLLSFLSKGLVPGTLYRESGLPLTPFLEDLTEPLPPFLARTESTGLSGWELTRGLSRERATALSFRKGPIAYRGNLSERKSGQRSLLALSAVLILVLILDAGVHLSRLNHQVERARTALAQISSRALPGHRIVEPVTQLKQELLALNRQKNLLSRGPDIIRIMKDLTSAPPKDVPFELVSLNVTRQSFTISGKTDSFKSVDRIKKELTASGHMKKLSIQSAGLDIDRKTVTFRIRGNHD